MSVPPDKYAIEKKVRRGITYIRLSVERRDEGLEEDNIPILVVQHETPAPHKKAEA